MGEPTAEQRKQLERFHRDAYDAEQRLNQARKAEQMATQTRLGAESEFMAKLSRFKGAAEFAFGTTEVIFDFDEKSGKLTFRPASVPPPHGLGKRRRK